MKGKTFARATTLALVSLLTLFFAVSILSAHEESGVVLSVQYDSLDRTVLTYEVSSYEQQTLSIEGRDYLALSLEHTGLLMMDRAGHPQLPCLCDSLLIPDRAQMGLRVTKTVYEDLELTGFAGLAPYRGTILRSVDPSTVPYSFGDVYRKDAWFPAEVASLRAPYILHDARGVVVQVVPFQYNPVKNVLRVYKQIDLEVFDTGGVGTNVIDRSVVKNRPDRSFEAIYKSQFVNYSGNRIEPPAEDGSMLIISHSSFMSAMQPLVTWKNSIGIDTVMVDVATIGSSAQDIWNYLVDAYSQNNLAYLLLVGDYAHVTSPNYSYGVSDPSYSTLTTDWYPDIFVGRFSAETLAHVQTQVQRTIEYEQQGHDVAMGDWDARATGIASSEGAGIGHYGESDRNHNALIRGELLHTGFTLVDQIYDPGATASQVGQALNEGRRFVTYTGHGWTQGWSTTGFTNSHVDSLTNVGKLPIISSVACNGGDFNYGTCFGEAWLRATYNGQPTGAVASYNSSVGQSWAPPMYGQGNHAKNQKYGGAERFEFEINWSVGGCWYGGGCAMMDAVGNDGREMFMTWHIFGDPSLRLNGQAQEATLAADAWQLPLNTAAAINFLVAPGASYAGKNYTLVGSATGDYPGTTLPGGVVLPMNRDWFTNIVIANLNTNLFQSFRGVLDASGQALATMDTATAVPLPPGLMGTKLWFSAVIGQPYELATNSEVLVVMD